MFDQWRGLYVKLHFPALPHHSDAMRTDAIRLQQRLPSPVETRNVPAAAIYSSTTGSHALGYAGVTAIG